MAHRAQLTLLLVDLDLAGPTDLEHSDTTTQLGEALLELALLVLRGGARDGDADLFSTNTNTVQHQGGDGIAVDIFRDDHLRAHPADPLR